MVDSAIQPISLPPQQTAPAPPVANPYPTVAQVMQVCPDSNVQNVTRYLPFILKAMAAEGLLSANQLIGILATIYVETTPFAPIKEYGGSSARYAPYFGRGFIQLTWKSNYEQAEKDLNLAGLVANPDMALDPEASAKILVWYWKGATGNHPAKHAEVANWRQVRKSVNGGYHGWDKFNGAVQRGLSALTQPLDPNAIGVLPIDGTYGTGCIDAGSAGSRTLSGGLNPTTQIDALALALGLHARDRQNGYRYQANLNVVSQPELLKLDVQKTFTVQGMGDKLDGEYTAEDVIFYPLAPGGIRVELNATKPDPDAPPPQVFVGDTTQGLTPPQPGQLATPANASEISARIAAAAKAAKGRSSRSGPGGGNVACAWAVNLFCILPAGVENIGKVKGQDNVTVSCLEMISALEGGRGRKVSRTEATEGVIWFAPNKHHVGVIVSTNPMRVLSNSSSRAAFRWEDDIDSVNNSGYYGRGQEYGLFQVIN